MEVFKMNFLRKRKPINHYETNYSNLVPKIQTKLDYINQFAILFKSLRMKKLLGLKGEYIVNKELQKLHDNYYVYYDISFRVRKKRCQIDHIVICSSGIFLIETKLWSSNFSSTYTPFKQLERSLKLFLEKFKGNYKLHVKQVLVSVNGSLEYNPEFKSIYVTSPSKLLKYIINCKKVYSENEVLVLKDLLERC